MPRKSQYVGDAEMDYRAAANEAKRRLAQIDAERNALVKFIESAEALAGIVPSPDAQAAPPSKGRMTRPHRPTGAMEVTRNAVEKALRSRGYPMQTRELLQVLTASGVEVGGKDSVATLSARLSNADEFVLHRGLGWWFSGQDVPAFDFGEAEDKSVEGTSSASNTGKGGSDMPPP